MYTPSDIEVVEPECSHYLRVFQHGVPGCKPSHIVRLIKLVGPVLVITFVAASTFQYISNNNQRMLRYEKEMSNLRTAIKTKEQNYEIRMKREVSESVKTQLGHVVSRRAIENVSSREKDFLEPKNAGGVTYIRWGRRDCPNGELSRFVYNGYMAASHYSHTGSGSDYLCLHWNVTYSPGHFVDGSQGSSYVYGVEFRDSSWMYKLFDLSLTETNALQFHSVPCSMCLAEARVAQMMIPGRETCPAGWNKEYTGYVMAGGHGDKHSTQFVCVDDRPQIVPGTIGDQKGGSLQMIETQCASLLCEPFVAGRELRCVVCTL